MKAKLKHIALLVKDYDEAIAFYTEKLNFTLIEDTPLSETKRWVLVSPDGGEGCLFLLAKAATDEQAQSIGRQSGGRVFLFLHTQHFEEEYANLLQQQIKIVRGPVTEPYGRVLVFEDLYGNLWDLIQPNQKNSQQ
ncbi:VOC family protein [Pararhodonellum marinum]|uniref:VOC family protein n=1 Tax=Pararhodonellum marinum TaxID=2755358 RepID=UPI00188EF95E|nr:VOC family protein [Pararhodonellum marinum]